MNEQRNFIQRILVSMSLLLLLGFLVFWNLQQYKTEKIDLVQKLNTEMSLACSEYRDSVVKDVFKLIKITNGTAKKDSSTFPSRLNRYSESIQIAFDDIVIPDSNVTSIQVMGPELDRYSGFHVSDHAEGDTLINFTLDDRRYTDDIVIWETVKDSNTQIDFAKDLKVDTTIIWGFPDGERFSKLNKTNDFPMPTLFNKIDSIFSQRLLVAEIKLPHDRVKSLNEDQQKENFISIPFKYETLGFSEPPLAVFRNYKQFLIAKLTPSLLISFLLFSIVALSFYFISKTWTEQLRLTKLKNEFISNMTHELNTPIATIGVALEALENYGAMDDPKRRKEYLNISKQEVGRLKFLVDKVLGLSAMDQNYNELNKTRVDLKKLLGQTIESLGLQLEKRKAKVAIDYLGEDFNINLDKEHFVNVIRNLVDNSIKYAKDEPRIKIVLEVKQETVKLNFSDNGIGIPKNYKSKIFDRFFRVPNEDKHNVKGHGLGLHYVKSIIEKHGGYIKLDDTSRGTSFTISMPKQ